MKPVNPVPTILSIQDMSSIGRCSLTVAVPIISALGSQAAPLPTALLCNHLEYEHYEMVDFSEHLDPFMKCWVKNDITFDAIQSGFLASPEQIHIVIEAINRFGTENTPIIVDPAMADDGHLYSVYNQTMIEEMRKLLSHAHIIKPNYTEATFLLDLPYEPENVTPHKVKEICEELHKMGPRHVIMSGVPDPENAVVSIYDGEDQSLQMIKTKLVPVKAHGTGDIFTAVLTGCLLQGYSTFESASLAAHFTTDAVKFTHDTIGSMRNGLLFEPLLGELTKLVKRGA